MSPRHWVYRRQPVRDAFYRLSSLAFCQFGRNGQPRFTNLLNRLASGAARPAIALEAEDRSHRLQGSLPKEDHEALMIILNKQRQA